MEHIRIDPKFRRRPRPKRAGWAAREIFKFLLEVSAEFDLRGRFPKSMQDPEWLADEWANGDESARATCGCMLAENLHRLVETGLLHVDGEELVITDWAEFYKPTLSGAERQAGYVKRKREQPASPVTEVTEPVTRDDADKSDATLLHSTQQHSTNGERAAPPVGVPSQPEPTADIAPKAPALPVAAKAAHVPHLPSPPTSPREEWLFSDFWAWAQHKRHQALLVPEPVPNLTKGAGWWSAARAVASTEELCDGFYAFGEDPHWQATRPKLPFAGFQSQWTRYVELRRAQHAPEG